MSTSNDGFAFKDIFNWEEFLGAINALKKPQEKWIFRGQTSDWPLKSSLERALCNYDIKLEKAPVIEEKLIRDFRRRYLGPHRDLALNDTLY